MHASGKKQTYRVNRKALKHDDSPAMRPYDAKGFREMSLPGRSRLQSGMAHRPASKSFADPRGPFSTQHKNKRKNQVRGPFGANVNTRRRRQGPVNSRGATLGKKKQSQSTGTGFGSL